MSDSKRQRQCHSCQFFQRAQLTGNGWCTHPKRQLASDVRILVREKELACRNSWGEDLWADASLSTTTPSSVEPVRPGYVYTAQAFDDEVTSVVDATTRHEQGASPRPDTGSSIDVDDVVTVTSVRPDSAEPPRQAASPIPDDLNAPALADQDERVRLMARGNRDAIIRARERHAERRAPGRQCNAIDMAGEPIDHDQVLDTHDRDQMGRATHRPDQLGVPLARDPYAATPPVPRSEMNTNRDPLAQPPDSDERFSSVPELKPDIALPRIRKFFSGDDSPAAGGTGSEPLSSYDHVLKRAQEIKAAAQTERDRESHHRVRRSQSSPKTTRIVAPTEQSPPIPAPAGAEQIVVWDLERERLNIAFDRARSAIETPPQGGLPAVAMAVSQQAKRDVAAPAIQVEAHPDAETGYADEPIDVDDSYADDDQAISYDIDSGFDQMPFDAAYTAAEMPGDQWMSAPDAELSPRASWWRSLNFGSKRRFWSTTHQVSPEIRETEPNDANGPDDYSDYHAEFMEESFEDDAYLPLARILEDDGFAADPGMLDIAASQEMDVTSEESWLEDVREFPQPSPAGWHEQRAQLVAWKEPIDSGDDSQLEQDPAVAHPAPLTPIFPERPSREPHAFFAIDEPSGMNAFRAALFHGDRSNRDTPNAFEAVVGDDPIGTNLANQAVPAIDTFTDAANRDPIVHTHANDRSNETGAPTRVHRRPRGHRSPSSLFAQPQTAFDTGFDIRDAIDEQDDEFERTFLVASGVEKMCATCRSFQKTGDGSRGWCTSGWASTNRQMVNANDLACRSSIGDWWLASDASWIPPTDVIQPETPRTDRLVARAPETTDDAGEQGERRVRTRKVV